MAETLQELQQYRAGLLKARASGVRSVKDQNGESVEYRSDSELAAALRDVESRIAEFPLTKPVKQIKFQTSKGL